MVGSRFVEIQFLQSQVANRLEEARDFSAKGHFPCERTEDNAHAPYGQPQLSLTGISLIPATKFERILRIGPLGSAFG